MDTATNKSSVSVMRNNPREGRHFTAMTAPLDSNTHRVKESPVQTSLYWKRKMVHPTLPLTNEISRHGKIILKIRVVGKYLLGNQAYTSTCRSCELQVILHLRQSDNCHEDTSTQGG